MFDGTDVSERNDAIIIRGAREHNLKNLSVCVPRGRIVVITGVSGSGKSTLAIDLLFAEGQRRFLDAMNAYARQFVEQLSSPEVDLVAGIPPTVSIEQRNSRGGGKSTVATVTEIYHFLRLLFARLGRQYCPDCRRPVESQTRDQVGRRLQEELKQRGDLLLLAPVVKNRKGFHTDVAEWAARHGYAEVRADGRICSTRERLRLDRFREHHVEIVVGVVDRQAGKGAAQTPQHLIDETLRLGQGTLLALDNHGQVSVHSTERACGQCGRSFEPLDPKQFSYNSSQGWCPKCRGFGELFYLPDVDRGARADAIEESWYEWQEGKRELCPGCHGQRLNLIARAVRLEVGQASSLSFRCGLAAGQVPAAKQERRGAFPTIDTFNQASVEQVFAFFQQLKLTGREACIARDILPEVRERLKFLRKVGLGYLQLGRGVPTLSGGEAQRIRLAAQLGSNLTGVLYVLDEPTIGLHARDNERLLDAMAVLKSRGNSMVVVEHDEATMRRADYIIDLGPGAGVNGGQVVACGTLDELLQHEDSITGRCLRQKPTFPSRGRRRPVVATANVSSWSNASPPSVSSQRESKARRGLDSGAAVPTNATTHGWLMLQDAALNNLRNLTVHFPLNRLVVVTGVSGSGKSTLVRECLLPALQTRLKDKAGRPAADEPRRSRGPEARPISACGVRNAQRFPESSQVAWPAMALGETLPVLASPSSAARPPWGEIVSGHESLRAVYEVDQSPIGRTPRSVPATYVGFFDVIRNLFAQIPEARLRGYTASRFSFNSPQGRCPECEGAGSVKLEMNFLPPAFARCEACGGRRFSRETLDIEFNGKNIAQVLDLSVMEAIEFFAAFPRIRRPLEALRDTGLGYLKLGQTSPTLSGGEAQRVKLVTHLLAGLKEQLTPFKPREKRNLFLLEEPTIGLHRADLRLLVDVLHRLVDAGHTVIVIEHNLDLIAEADWIIDLGPEGGAGGGQIVAVGTPEAVAQNKRSHTGRFLRSLLASTAGRNVRHRR